MPDNVAEFLLVKIDHEPLPPAVIQGLVLTVNAKQYPAENLKDLNGQTLPVGGSLKFFVPYEALKRGEEHEIEIDVKSTKFRFTMSRVIQ